MAITWTKEWSVDDDGSLVHGADIGQIQDDIADKFAAGIVNADVNASAGIEESKIAFSNAAAGHQHDNTAAGGSYVVMPNYKSGCEVEWVSVSSIKAKPGILEIDGKTLVRTAFSSTIVDTTDGDWADGSNAAGASKWYYIYAYNDSGVSWDIKFHESAPNASDTSSNTDGELIYRQISSVWYRCIGACRNDSGSDILKFVQFGNQILFDTWTTVKSAGADTSFTDVDCSAIIPNAISRRGIFVMEGLASGAGQMHIRQNGSTSTDGHRVDATDQITCEMLCDTDSSEVIEYKVSASSADIHVKGYHQIV